MPQHLRFWWASVKWGLHVSFFKATCVILMWSLGWEPLNYIHVSVFFRIIQNWALPSEIFLIKNILGGPQEFAFLPVTK